MQVSDVSWLAQQLRWNVYRKEPGKDFDPLTAKGHVELTHPAMLTVSHKIRLHLEWLSGRPGEM